MIAYERILVINHFLKSEKLMSLHSHLLKTAAACGINIVQKTNLELAPKRPNVICAFWTRILTLRAGLKTRGLRCLNSARSIALCDEKAKTYLALERHRAPARNADWRPLLSARRIIPKFIDAAIE
jgi:glutathione synthase/RimK-type ligase-like ATP-grasp enzyme